MVKERGGNIFHSPGGEEGKLEYFSGGEGSEEHFSGVDRADSEPDNEEENAAIEVDTLRQRVDELEKEKEEMNNRMLRLQADFENFRRRVRTEKEELVSYANFDLMQKLLPVVDNMERALSASQKGSEGIMEGLEMIKKQFLDILSKEGVTPTESLGKPFDPNFHDAVFREKCSDYPPGTVMEELQKGYMFNDKVLRASMVKVSAE